MLQGMKDTYSTYMDSIQAALDSPSSGDGSGGGAIVSPSAAAAAAEAAVNGAPQAGSGATADGMSASGVGSPAVAQGPLPATPPGKAQQQQTPPQWVSGSPVALQLWQRWFRDLAAMCLLLLSLWLLRRAVESAAAAAGSGSAPGFWQGRRVVFAPGSTWPQLQATRAAISQ